QIFSKLVIAKDRAIVSEDSKNFLDRVIVSAHRMQQLIDDLISYSRTSSISKISYIPTDMNMLIDEALVDLEEVIEAEKPHIEVDDLPVLAVLPSQFRQLFVNLISNAIKYRNTSERPQIKISGDHAKPEELETFNSKAGQDYYKITVSDNGIGFLPEYSEKIFEPFQRLHDKDEYSGTGIGLAICKKIMLNHNGCIRAESTPGKGSTFLIYTPWAN
ncbi:MAG TPA: ATP-binding protein, partial [Flavobacterium sp.]|nr:ATP-binding protein [Flavobacterium sp.]